MNASLFPDYSVLETVRNSAQAERLARQLREVDLQVMVTDADRRQVIGRLRREGIDNVMSLILLTEDAVANWVGVGPVFLSVLDDIRREVLDNPEAVVQRWHHEFRLLVLPDDLSVGNDEDDFFGLVMEDEDCELYGQNTTVEYSPIRELEDSLVAAIEMLERRWRGGVVLRRFYLEGVPVETIVKNENLTSNVALFRLVDDAFSEPLQKGYAIKGIQFSNSLLSNIKSLKKDLLYKQSKTLDALTRIPPMRFLHFLGMTLLQRTTAEPHWDCDYIVRVGEVERTRYTLRDLMSFLQWRVVSTKENVIRRALRGCNVNFLRALLRTHPSIEENRKGYRLAGERLSYDCARLARIVYDARRSIRIDEVVTIYEQKYMERPQTVSISNVRNRFPQVHSVKRGYWAWK